jgi:RNA polymerase sigma-70 factor (ECF subfamily)
MEEKVLVQRSKEGDQEAFSALVHKYKTKVFRLAFSLTHDRDIADDLAQEAFIRAYLSLPKFQQKSEFGTWLYRITVNHTMDYLRKKTRRKEVPLDDLAISQEEETLTPENDKEEEQKRTILYRSLAELPEKYKLILNLRDRQGFSYAEIAKILKVSPGTVDSRLHRAREMLRKKIRPFLERRQP